MNSRKSLVLLLLASAVPAPAWAQETPPPAEEAPPADASALVEEAALEPEAPQTDDEALDEEEGEEGEEIVIRGQRPRGSVIGDIEPEVTLNAREIRSFGASNLAELLDALAPQTRSGRGRGGGGPVVLLNGRRISGFREIRDIPPEAIQRVEVLPEEVALKYGYRADQRVVNFVTRRRFRAITGEVEGGLATAGGRGSYEADVNMLRINRDGRISLDAEYEHADPLFESERDIIQADPLVTDLGDFRTLLAETDRIELGGTVNRTILGDVSATLNGRFEASDSESFLSRRDFSDDPLMRRSDTLAGRLGFSLNGQMEPWRWSATGNYDRTATDTKTERNGPADVSETETEVVGLELVVNGPLFDMPAGDLSTSIRAGGQTLGIESDSRRSGIAQNTDLSRRRVNLQTNVDVPIASRRREVLGAIGDVSVNFNGEVEHLSDFGTLRTLGAGFNWSPIEEVDLIGSFTDEDGAPTIQQLGDPVVVTPNVRVFDFSRGETVDVERLEGGNPVLLADNRRVFKLGATIRPLDETNLSITANYVKTRITDVIASFPTATPEIEAAFPDRFVRGADGRLLRIDSRPVNFARSDTEELRWGVNFSKPLGPVPSQEDIQRMREERRTRRLEGQAGGQGGDEAGRSRRGGGGFGGGGFGRGGGFGGFGGGRFGRGGQLQLALYHTWRFKDEILIREGVPILDLLEGSATGSRGGRPAHELEFQAGVFKNGLGARLSANWQSETFVRGGLDRFGATTSDLFFSDFATVNLRLFADLGQQRSLVQKHPWLRGMRVTLAFDNLFDARLRVRDETGVTPLSYQPDLLDPLGRSVRISLRKLFF